jgi:8-amino-7-oxononanoate synthase
MSTSRFDAALAALDAQQQRRVLTPLGGAGLHRECDGQVLIDFSSNQYLGLSQHPALTQAAIEAIQADGVGAGASRLVSGSSLRLQALEAALARWKGTEAALVFNSGYAANVAVLTALPGPDDVILADRDNHASLIDGMRWSAARWHRYAHNDITALENRLKRLKGPGQSWIVTDSVFSMTGDQALLPEIAQLAARYGAFLLVDEAHATGLYGPQRRSGLCEADGVTPTLHLGTFSKALGGVGAYVAGPQAMIEMLINKARPFVYTTAPPPPVVAAALAAVELVQADPGPTAQLWANVAHVQQGLSALGWHFERRYPSPIFPLEGRDNAQVLAWSAHLKAAGYWVQAIRPPTVPRPMLRLTVSAGHTPVQLAALLNDLENLR